MAISVILEIILSKKTTFKFEVTYFSEVFPSGNRWRYAPTAESISGSCHVRTEDRLGYMCEYKTSPDWLRFRRGHLMHSVNTATLQTMT